MKLGAGGGEFHAFEQVALAAPASDAGGGEFHAFEQVAVAAPASDAGGVA